MIIGEKVNKTNYEDEYTCTLKLGEIYALKQYLDEMTYQPTELNDEMVEYLASVDDSLTSFCESIGLIEKCGFLME